MSNNGYNRKKELGYTKYQTQYTAKDRDVTITEKELGYTRYQTQYTTKDKERDYNRREKAELHMYQTQYTAKDIEKTRLHKVSNPIRLGHVTITEKRARLHGIKPNTRLRTGNVTITEERTRLHKVSNPIRLRTGNVTITERKELGYTWYQTQYTAKDRERDYNREKRARLHMVSNPIRTGNVTIGERARTWYQTYTEKNVTITKRRARLQTHYS
ncbi:unnamed protein product [Mytilus edulis]|uniref:Uncharacterized protein n=1 Tax=Mytilus edulis TaxID=6550 RepID=A0A8S3PXW1_MYTED|nr:unnamed protein product [Mytilus edulis]